jgi:hypothetical protein
LSLRAFIVLLVATAIALVGAIVLAVEPNLSATQAVGGDPMFKALGDRVADVTKLVVQTPQYKASWEKRNGTWVATDHGDYPTKETLVADVISGLAAMTTVEPKTNDPAWYPYIMVGDPAATPPTGGPHVTASAANGDVLADAIIGVPSESISASHGRGGSFVRREGEAQSWLVEGSTSVPAALSQWFDPIVNIPGPDVTDVAVLVGAKSVFEAHKADPKTGIYTLVNIDPAEGAAAGSVANVNAIRDMTSAVVGVTIEDARALDGVTPGDTSQTDRFTSVAGLQLDVTLVDADGATWAIFKASAPNGGDAAKAAADINALTEKWAFRLDAARLAKLAAKPANLVQTPQAQLSPGALLPNLSGIPIPRAPVPGNP